ncbi:MAG TPA: ribonuclease P protein component [Acidobacteriaceae bacterium]|nr:ribonuclease P protein component [Acidobacteriaceae bacterium]
MPSAPVTAIKRSLHAARRLRDRSEFRMVYEQGTRRYSPHFVMFALSHTRTAGTQGTPDGSASASGSLEAGSLTAEQPALPLSSPSAPSRFGITVSRKLGRATVRNRIRRRTREILRRHVEELGSGWDIVINPRRTVLEAEFALLEEELMELLRRLTSTGSAGTPRSRMRDGRSHLSG